MRRSKEILIMGDLGINATTAIIEDLKTEGERAAHQRAFCLQTASDRQHQSPDECR